MLNIIGKKNWYFLISLLVIIPGLYSLFAWGLRLSIDFTGGSRMSLVLPSAVENKAKADISRIFESEKTEIVTITSKDKILFVRTKPIDEKVNQKILKKLQEKIKGIKQEGFETIGPTIGQETTWNAIKALFLAAGLIVIYIAWSFRSVPRPTSSWKFGICAIIALIHDGLVVVGIFSLLGHFWKVEIDSLFVTALLTVIGFSVHDTIVVFDRIRENLRTDGGGEFAQTVNNSILQTLTRSLNTSLTAILVLVTMLIFGGETLKWFIVALLIGIASGTYSSIFNASALLVVWHDFDIKQKKIPA